MTALTANPLLPSYMTSALRGATLATPKRTHATEPTPLTFDAGLRRCNYGTDLGIARPVPAVPIPDWADIG